MDQSSLDLVLMELMFVLLIQGLGCWHSIIVLTLGHQCNWLVAVGMEP